ncbi:MAG: hypothetical protein IPJ09_15620 [Saprospiraceae bacterium]|nr:hypothetical protein [Saprospiraceae bacterium]
MENRKNKFDFEAFAKQASEALKSGKPMVGGKVYLRLCLKFGRYIKCLIA